jgi:hypothetical protein
MSRIFLAATFAALSCAFAPVVAQTNEGEPAAQTESEAPAYSDEQIAGFLAAREEIQTLTPGQTADEQRANAVRISEILSTHNISAYVYNGIDERARTDQDLANRIAVARLGDGFSDEQLTAFAAASAEIDPITRTLATATPEEQQQAAAQIRAILGQHQLDIEVYNGIAAQAQTDADLAARIAALQMPAMPETEAEDSAEEAAS